MNMRLSGYFNTCSWGLFIYFIAIVSWCAGGGARALGDDASPKELAAKDVAGKSVVSMAWGWPFLAPEQMEPRGGTTHGSEVTLAAGPSDAWKALQASGMTPFEQDRRAILAMAGTYRVSFQFVETLGFSDDYRPPRPYFSWGTEEVRVLENRDRFISLQHTLVMFFADENGAASQAYVTKHWRQDWTYEDQDLHVHRGDLVWQRQKRSPAAVQGQWSQAVYQVDDSPRYEAIGRWEHAGDSHRWTSEVGWRPLPRREFSVRDDYNVLAGTNVVTITPTGWVHTEDNRKIVVSEGKEKSCLAFEAGINRYERIVEPDVATPANEYWTATSDYWREVRSAWTDVLARHDRVELKAHVDDSKLYEDHFGFAQQIEESKHYDAAEGRAHARATIEKFLVKSAASE